MVQINFAQKQINAKVVYYGPGMSGKTTNLEVVHQRAPDKNRGDLTSISTDGDRTLFFDYMPLDLGTIAGMKTCFQMYTVPGQVYYNSTRKLVLQGVDGVIFVADSSPDAMEANLESLRNLEENLNEYGKSLATLPHVVQFNKRDIPGALGVEQMMAQLNAHGVPTFEAIAATGQGVFPTLKGLASLVLKSIQAECSSPSGGLASTGFRRAPDAATSQQGSAHGSQQGNPSHSSLGGAPAPMPQQPAAPQPMAQQPPMGQPPVAPHPGTPPAMPQASASQLGQTGYHQPPQVPQQPQYAQPQPPAPQPQQGLEQTGVYAQPQAAPQQQAPGELMRQGNRTAQRGQVTPKRRPSPSQAGQQRARSTAPAPTAGSGGGGLVKTAIFVVLAAAVGAVVAHFVLGAL
ncbi:MAG: ADP-ribosylation factor-like protein [Planctomycetota bacterium]